LTEDRRILVWETQHGRLVGHRAAGGDILRVEISHGGAQLAWLEADGRLVRTVHGDAEEFRSLALTPDSQSIAAAGKGKVIRFWDVATGQQVLSLEGHQAPINALAFSPDGSMLASCSHDGAVHLWHASPIDPLAKR
jgi:WD40 repeat protein